MMPEKGTSTLRMRVCRQCGIEFADVAFSYTDED